MSTFDVWWLRFVNAMFWYTVGHGITHALTVLSHWPTTVTAHDRLASMLLDALSASVAWYWLKRIDDDQP